MKKDMCCVTLNTVYTSDGHTAISILTSGATATLGICMRAGTDESVMNVEYYDDCRIKATCFLMNLSFSKT